MTRTSDPGPKHFRREAKIMLLIGVLPVVLALTGTVLLHVFGLVR